MFRSMILPAAGLLALAIGASQPATAALVPNALNSNGLGGANGISAQGLALHGRSAGGVTGGARIVAIELPRSVAGAR
jgi:hypothetical protein